DGWIFGWPLGPAVPTEVVVDAVTISFAVRQVVLGVVRHEIVQREAVMGGHEVDAVLGRLPTGLIDIRAPAKPRGDRARHPRVALDEPPDVISIAAIPFGPAIARKVTDLIQTSG